MLSEVLDRLRRYWPVTLVGVIASVGLSAWILVSLPPRFDATRSILFVPSPTSEDPERPLNPFYSYLTDSLATAITIISIIVSDEGVAERVAPEGSGTDYEVAPDVTVRAPVLVIEVTGPSPEAADSVADELSALVAETLAAQQEAAGGPESTWIGTTQISSSLEPERNWSKAVQLAAVGLALGIAVTVGLVALLSNRASRRQSAHEGDQQGGVGPPAAGPEADSRFRNLVDDLGAGT